MDGYITGVRFYKGAAEHRPAHRSPVDRTPETLLAQATFTSATTATGWQRVTFPSPVTIAANTTYVASYHTSIGDTTRSIGRTSRTSGHHESAAAGAADGQDGANGVFVYARGSRRVSDRDLRSSRTTGSTWSSSRRWRTSPPTAANDSYSVAPDATLTIPASGRARQRYATPIPGTTLSAAARVDDRPRHLALNPSGSFIYTPAAGFTGTDSFTYRANDGQDNSNVATVTINVSVTDVQLPLQHLGSERDSDDPERRGSDAPSSLA